jgi:lysophospholipase L1-like esterase
MKSIKAVVLGLAMATCGQAALAEDGNPDWANLGRYQAGNSELVAKGHVPHRVVFMGDSITEGWYRDGTGFFANPTYVDRGISGQTTSQMVLRFHQDVIDLSPEVVVILAGTNDIAGNTGPMTNEQIAANIEAMAEMAHAHGIKVVLCALVPADHYGWAPEVKPAPRIVALNGWIKAYAKTKGFGYVDYYTPMVDDKGGLKSDYTADGVHPLNSGYAVMEKVVSATLTKTIGK